MSTSNSHQSDLVCESQLEDVLIKREPTDCDENEHGETPFISTVKKEAPDSDEEEVDPAGMVKIELEEGQIDPADLEGQIVCEIDPADMEECQIDPADHIEEGQIDPAGMIISDFFNDKQIYKCQECDFKTRNKIEFMQHVIVGHQGFQQCIYCYYMTRDEDDFRRHMLTHKTSLKPPGAPKRKYEYNKSKPEKYILPPGFSSRLHMINVLCNVWRSLGQGIWSCFNHHQLCKHSEHCGFCYVRNLSLRTSAGRKKTRNNLEPFEIQTFLDILGGEEVEFKEIISASIYFLGNCEPTVSSGCYYLEVSEDICESTSLSAMIEKSADGDKFSLQELKDKKVIFIFLEKATQVEIDDTFVFDSTEFKYGSHIQEMNPKEISLNNEYKCHFLHNNRIVCDDKGAIMPSSTSNNENTKFIVLINTSFNSEVPNDFIYGDTAMKYIKKKSFQAMDKQKFEAHKNHLKGYQKMYRGDHKEDLKEYQKRYTSGFFKRGMMDKDYDEEIMTVATINNQTDTSDEVSKERMFEEAEEEVSKKRKFEDDASDEVSKKIKVEVEAEDEARNDELISEEKKIECNVCDFVTARNDALIRHMATVHNEEKNIKCNECDFATNRNDNMLRHNARVHTEERKIKCINCDFVTKGNDALIRHMATVHSEEKNIKCNECDFATNRTDNMLRHYARVHSEGKKIKCINSKNNELKRHASAVHSEEGKIKCNICDFVTTRSKELMKHLETVHSKYNCNECNFCTSKNETLIRHIATVHATAHGEDEKEKNKYNRLSFVATSLNYAVGKSEKRFQCGECKFATTRKSTLNRHVQRRHTQKNELNDSTWMAEGDDHLLSSLVCEPQLGDFSTKQEPDEDDEFKDDGGEDDEFKDDGGEDDGDEDYGATPFVSTVMEDHQDDDGIKVDSNDEDFNVIEDGEDEEDEEEKWVQRWKMSQKEGGQD